MTEATLGPTASRVLLALIDVYGREGRATVRAVGLAAGVPSTSTQKYLLRLRSAGLVAWDDYRAGTLRPLVAFVPYGDQT